MENIFFEELRYDNVGKEGIFVIYNSDTYKITEKHFLIQQANNKNQVIYKTLYEYFFEDNNIESISKYILAKYEYDIIYLLFADYEIDKNDDIFKDLSKVFIENYITDLRNFSK